MGDVDAEAIAQELVAKKTPLLREEIMQLAFYLPDQGQHKAAGERGSGFLCWSLSAWRHYSSEGLVPFVAMVDPSDHEVHPAKGAGDRVHVFRYPLRSGGETPS